MSSATVHQRPAQKKPSLLSLRQRDRALQDTPQPTAERPFLLQRGQSYFDRYPRQPSAPSSSRSESQKPPPRRPSISSSLVDTDSPSPENSPESPQEPSYAFPIADRSILSSSFFNDGELTPKPPARRRSRTKSDKAHRRPPTDVAHLRMSNSSFVTQVETPPQTPIDFPMPRLFVDPFPVVVSAPISGVETMDALVDGMNGYEGDDFFMGGGGISARSLRLKERFHPLYQPPLPTPPPGITLGGGVPRKHSNKLKNNTSEDDLVPLPPSVSTRRPSTRSEDDVSAALPTPTSARRPHRLTPVRTASNSTITVNTVNTTYSSTLDDPSPPASPQLSPRNSKSMAPSISEIIRTYAPPEQQARSRPSNSRASQYASSHGHAVVHEEEHESEPEPVSAAEEAEIVSRSSVDSIADEVRRTLRNQSASPVVQPPPPVHYTRSLPSRHSFMSDGSLSVASPRLDAPSSYHSSLDLDDLPTPIELPTTKPTQSQAIATYLHSARLTTLLKLTRSPHASIENPLTVSLSDLGSPTGVPLVVFLGLGSVRYVMGLYDEMAECLGIRLITIDRWGLGRTDTPKHKSARGIPEWASVVEEVLDLLHIDQVSVMAHSAGAPYALSFANKVPERVKGEVLLLAPWVGGVEGAGYKWLKFVPNGILKTAQAAEWKIQAWMLGKPPTIAYQGIGYNANTDETTSSPNARGSSRRRSDNRASTVPPAADALPRPSVGSSVFSEYDDLRDFEGRFDSRSTLGVKSSNSHRSRTISECKPSPRLAIARKTSKGFLNRLKGTSVQTPPSSSEKSPTSTGGKRLKALRSMSSLKGRSSNVSQSPPVKAQSTPPRMPDPINVDVGLGFDAIDWASTVDTSFDVSPSSTLQQFPSDPAQDTLSRRSTFNRRADGRRSVSFGATPPPSTLGQASSGIAATSAYQAALGNALIVASHAESSKGTHSDLLQILNHDQQPWGFSYAAYPHRVRVWYGDRDEKIAENAVRWMERTMRDGRCQVTVVKGADHGLMYRSSVVVEVLERVRDVWAEESPRIYDRFRSAAR